MGNNPREKTRRGLKKKQKTSIPHSYSLDSTCINIASCRRDNKKRNIPFFLDRER